MPNKLLTKVIKGKIFDIEDQYKAFLEKDITIVSTSLSQDFERYGHTECFVLLITYYQNEQQ